VELGHLVAEREEPEMSPVGLGLNARCGLEADLGIPDCRWPDLPELALEGGVAAGERVVALQLAEEIGAPDARADSQAALDMGHLGLAQRPGLGSLRIPPRPLGLHLPLDGAAVETELPGQGAERPPVAAQDVQLHPGFSRLQGVPPAVRGFRHHEPVRGDLPPVDHDDGPPVLLGDLCTFGDQPCALFMRAHNVTVEVAGMTMVAAITVDAVKDLGLAQGSEVTVIVKVSDVMLATRS